MSENKPELEYRKYDASSDPSGMVGCPECGWDEPDNLQRYVVVKKEETIDGRTFVSHVGISIIKNYWKPVSDDELAREEEDTEITVQVKEQIYPKVENLRTASGREGKEHRWNEIHCCPAHGEYTIENGYP